MDSGQYRRFVISRWPVAWRTDPEKLLALDKHIEEMELKKNEATITC